MNPDNIILIPLTLYAVLASIFYFVPWLVAHLRGADHSGAIFVLNLLLGWTFIGWVGALIWAMLDSVVRYDDDEHDPFRLATASKQVDASPCPWDFKRAFPPVERDVSKGHDYAI